MIGKFPVAVLFICLLQLSTACNVSHRVSDRDLTVTAIESVFFRTEGYVTQQHELPESLSQLPARKGYKDDAVDGWGNELHFEIDDENVVRIFSLGSDGQPGGSMSASDIELSFRIDRKRRGVEIVEVNRSWN